MECLTGSAPKNKKAGQNCTNNRDINQNHSDIKNPGTSNGTSVFEEVLGGEGGEEVVGRGTRSHATRLLHRMRS